MIAGLINLIVYLLIIGVLYALVVYVLSAIPVPEPIARIVKVVLVVILALIVIMLLFDLLGGGTGFNLPRVAN